MPSGWAVAVNSLDLLKQAIDSNDLDRVKALMTADPALHQAPMGYGNDGPLTWAAECRVPFQAPTPARLAIARWMIENGSDVHQGGDGPLMRAALNKDRIAMMDLLLAHGADVNALWHASFPIIFAPCECVNPPSLEWLLNHGADPNPSVGHALDYLIGTYPRSPARLKACIDLLLQHGARTRYDVPGVFPILRGRLDRLAALLDADPQLVHRRFPGLDFGSTGSRRLLLTGATLLHVAAEFGEADVARLLLDRGADVNASAEPGGQTPIFHAVSQFDDFGLPLARLLIERGAGLSLRAHLPGHYEQPGEFVDCTPLGYALRFPGGDSQTIALLRAHNAPE